MMGLKYVVVLVIVGCAMASPHGYGTKGGAAARADASAVAGAYAGAGGIPLSIPSNTGYSGSYSKSYSSSASSSSASSSSSSFSYTGSGTVGFPGTIGGEGVKGCVSGNCHDSSLGATQGLATGSGSQVYSDANAGSLAGVFGGKIPSGSYAHKYNQGSQVPHAENCASGDCQQNVKESDTATTISGTETSSLSVSSAKAAASADTKLTSDSANCGGSHCNNSPINKPTCTSGECDSSENVKCSSINCAQDTHASAPSSNNGDKTCTSGECASKHNNNSPNIEHGNNDIHVPLNGASYAQLNNVAPYSSEKTIGKESVPSCSSGNCSPSVLIDPKPNQIPFSASATAADYNKPAIHLTAPKLESPCTNANCQTIQENVSTGYGSNKNTFDYSKSAENYPSCIGNSCGTTKAPYSSNSENHIIQTPTSSQSGLAKVNPVISHGSSPSNTAGKLSTIACTPGNPGCATIPSAGHLPRTESMVYFYGSSNSPCALGTSGCLNKPSDCITGNCGFKKSPSIHAGSTNVKPGHSYESHSSYSPSKSVGLNCAPGAPGCAITPTVSDSTKCSTGNCGAFPSTQGYAVSSKSPTNAPVYSASSPCPPGKAGCNSAPSLSFGSSHNLQATQSLSHSPSTLCVPGELSCSPSASNCESGNCGGVPFISGHVGSINVKPSYSQGITTSYVSTKPAGLACIPGKPGCVIAPPVTTPAITTSTTSSPVHSSPNIIPYEVQAQKTPNNSDCAPGTPNCTPGPSFDGPSNSLLPSGSLCSSGAPGCSSNTSPTFGGSHSIVPSYAQSTVPLLSPLAPPGTSCSPGTPGCVGQSFSTKPGSYSHGNIPSSSSTIPSQPACAPGTPGCTLPTTASGSSSCVSGNCDSYPSSGYTGSFIKPGNYIDFPPYPPAPAGPACVPGSTQCGQESPALGHSTPQYGASGLGSSLTQATFGSHSAGSIQYNKPGSVFTPNTPSGSGTPSTTYPVQNLAPSLGNHEPYNPGLTLMLGAAAASSGHGDTKDKPVYHGGFGGPAGILKPNEFTVSSPSINSKPSSPIVSPIAPCISGKCQPSGQAPSSVPHSVSNGALSSAVASASANAVAYTGGFGGPPGVLKPYDGGKIDINSPNGNLHSAPESHQGFGSAPHSYSNGGLNTGVIATGQSNAASLSTNGGYGNVGAGGCDGECGGNHDHTGSLGHSENSGWDSGRNIAGVANAGTLAKSIATSGAGAIGGSYASSSATAHASAGSAVKGGYGRR